MSFIETEKSRGPKREPWGIPDATACTIADFNLLDSAS